jgi:hypothetical protein
LVSAEKLAPLFGQAPEGCKENSPGRKPGVGSGKSVEPGKGDRKGCEQRSFAPAGALSIQHPIRGLAPPATVSWPLRGCTVRVQTVSRDRN